MTPPHGWRIYTHLTSSQFSLSVAHSANSSFLQPIGKYSLHVWVQVQCKAATAFTQSESRRVEARVGSGSQLRNGRRNARRPGQSDRRGIENLCFQTTTVAISGFLVSLKVMYGRVKSKRETWSDCDGSKDPPKVWRCAIVDRRMAIDDRRLRRSSTTWETNLEAHRSLEIKVLTKAKVLTAISRGKPPN